MGLTLTSYVAVVSQLKSQLVTINILIQHTGTSTFIGRAIQQNNTRLTIDTKGTIKINMVN